MSDERRRPVVRRRTVRGPSGRASRRPGLDTPVESRRRLPSVNVDPEMFGRWSEAFARRMGTAWFIVGMTVFVAVWLVWNTVGPADLQFDPRALNYTLLTLILSLQASYAAPLILLAQNRQADRDRVSLEQDRQRAERNLADTEYLAREVAALRIALRDVATRDFLRGELRDLLEELAGEEGATRRPSGKGGKGGKGAKAAKHSKDGPKDTPKESPGDGDRPEARAKDRPEDADRPSPPAPDGPPRRKDAISTE